VFDWVSVANNRLYALLFTVLVCRGEGLRLNPPSQNIEVLIFHCIMHIIAKNSLSLPTVLNLGINTLMPVAHEPAV